MISKLVDVILVQHYSDCGIMNNFSLPWLFNNTDYVQVKVDYVATSLPRQGSQIFFNQQGLPCKQW